MPKVLQRSGVTLQKAAAPPLKLKDPANKRGSTEHFTVYVDPGLGPGGKEVADGVLAGCEKDYGTISGYFGGLTAGPFNVILFANPGGAYHLACDATDIFCDARTSPGERELSEFLNVAEFVEVFEAVQGKGWDCGGSNGEGLSRVLATDLHPGVLDGFATAADWLDSKRQDFVDKNEKTDTDPRANGCSVLFLNWMRFQLGISWTRIVGAAGATLAHTYSALTEKNDGFRKFEALLEEHFPPGRPSGLSTDNPFPLT